MYAIRSYYAIWGGTIVNATGHSSQRRVDMVFGIGYSDDIAKAQSVLEQETHKALHGIGGQHRA